MWYTNTMEYFIVKKKDQTMKICLFSNMYGLSIMLSEMSQRKTNTIQHHKWNLKKLQETSEYNKKVDSQYGGQTSGYQS